MIRSALRHLKRDTAEWLERDQLWRLATYGDANADVLPNTGWRERRNLRADRRKVCIACGHGCESNPPRRNCSCDHCVCGSEQALTDDEAPDARFPEPACDGTYDTETA